MDSNYALHEQVMYESIMDGCLYLGDEFVSLIEGELTSDTKKAILESVNGYIVKNCQVFGDMAPDDVFTESKLLEYGINKVLATQRYLEYENMYTTVMEVGTFRARKLQRVGRARIERGRDVNKAANKNLKWAKNRFKNTGASMGRAKAFAQTGHYGKAAGSAIRGGAQAIGGAAAGALGVERKLVSKYLHSSGRKFLNKPLLAKAQAKRKKDDEEAITKKYAYV